MNVDSCIPFFAHWIICNVISSRICMKLNADEEIVNVLNEKIVLNGQRNWKSHAGWTTYVPLEITRWTHTQPKAMKTEKLCWTCQNYHFQMKWILPPNLCTTNLSSFMRILYSSQTHERYILNNVTWFSLVGFS